MLVGRMMTIAGRLMNYKLTLVWVIATISTPPTLHPGKLLARRCRMTSLPASCVPLLASIMLCSFRRKSLLNCGKFSAPACATGRRVTAVVPLTRVSGNLSGLRLLISSISPRAMLIHFSLQRESIVAGRIPVRRASTSLLLLPTRKG